MTAIDPDLLVELRSTNQKKLTDITALGVVLDQTSMVGANLQFFIEWAITTLFPEDEREHAGLAWQVFAEQRTGEVLDRLAGEARRARLTQGINLRPHTNGNGGGR